MENDELMHYGVLGMKWGVRRANKALSKATTADQRNKALNKLSTHREKSVKKVAKLDNQISKLQKRAAKDSESRSYKAAKLARRGARLERKTHRLIRIRPLDRVRKWRAVRLDRKSETMRANIERTKSNLAKSRKMRDAFSTNISNIDRTLIENGRKILGE